MDVVLSHVSSMLYFNEESHNAAQMFNGATQVNMIANYFHQARSRY